MAEINKFMDSIPKLATRKNCTGCLICLQICPKNAISSYIDDEGHYMSRIDEKLCIKCKLCETTCPVVSGYKYGENNLSLSTPYAAWNRDEELRKKSASGGIFAALAVQVIKDGGYVAGAAMEGLFCRHILINSLQELPRLQGSKYTQSYTGDIYQQVFDRLKEGCTVLFSGTPCQNASLLNNIAPKYRENLICVDIICSHVPSQKLIQLFVNNENNDTKEIVSFRNKDTGWKPNGYKYQLIIKDSHNKEQYIKDNNIIIKGFTRGMTGRHSCYNCKYTFAHRDSDITIGDLWGDYKFLDEHFLGLSVAVVHSKNGERIISESNIELHNIKWNDFIPFNARMVYGKKSLGGTLERQYFYWILTHLPYSQLRNIYAGNWGQGNIIQTLYKIIIKIRAFIPTLRLKRVIRKILKQEDNG